MRRCLIRLPFAVVALIAALLGALSPLPAVEAAPSPGAVHGGVQAAPEPAAGAWILVDADRGVVLDGRAATTPRLVASTTKLLTALVARRHLEPSATVVVSERAAAMPPRKLDVRPGERWRVQDLLYGLLLSSANDVAAVLAEGSAGTLEAFAGQLQAAADELGLGDAPVLADPSGLDDGDSVGGGNLISARDLAIVARAVLADPLLAQIVATPRYDFVDPSGRLRRLGNHNKMLGSYPGTIGLKTGYTERAGQCLVAAATRDGRTLISVVLGAASLYGDTQLLLDKGFAMAPQAVGTGDRLPPIVELAPAATDAGRAASAAAGSAGAGPGAPAGATTAGRLVGHPFTQLLVVLGGLVAGLRARVKLRRTRRRRRRERRRAWHHHPSTQPTVAPRPHVHNAVDNRRRAGDNRHPAGDLLGISRSPIDGRPGLAHAARSRSTTNRGDTGAASERRRGLG